MASVVLPPEASFAPRAERDASTGVSPSLSEPTWHRKRPAAAMPQTRAASPSRFAHWLALEPTADKWASLAALAVGVLALVAVSLL